MFLIVCIFVYFTSHIYAADNPYNEELSILELITSRGYPVTLYQNLVTEDDYLLDMQRIPHGKNSKGNLKKKQPVVFMPPLLTSAEVYVSLETNLPFALADAGFDVWLGNPRGSMYSRKHLRLPTHRNSTYWDYSWHEKGYYDLPTFIDFVLRTTGYDKVFIVGYSEGTTSTFVLFTERPEYNDKVKLVIELAPSVYLGHTTMHLLRYYANRINFLRQILLTLGVRGAFFDHHDIAILKNRAYDNETKGFCQSLIGQFMEADNIFPENYNITPCQILAVGLHGVSLNELTHYAQLITSNDFRHFDYGPEQNKIIYGYEKPPRYDLSKFTAPVALFYSPDDYFSQPADMRRLLKNLHNVVYVKSITNLNFSHYDFIIHPNIKKVIYEDIIKLMNKNNY